ncbi:hypothetical protein ES703_116441 [subsurface metagenome]
MKEGKLKRFVRLFYKPFRGRKVICMDPFHGTFRIYYKWDKRIAEEIGEIEKEEERLRPRKKNNEKANQWQI